MLKFLSRSASELIRDAEGVDIVVARQNLAEAAELLNLGARILDRRAAALQSDSWREVA